MTVMHYYRVMSDSLFNAIQNARVCISTVIFLDISNLNDIEHFKIMSIMQQVSFVLTDIYITTALCILLWSNKTG